MNLNKIVDAQRKLDYQKTGIPTYSRKLLRAVTEEEKTHHYEVEEYDHSNGSKTIIQIPINATSLRRGKKGDGEQLHEQVDGAGNVYPVDKDEFDKYV